MSEHLNPALPGAPTRPAKLVRAQEDLRAQRAQYETLTEQRRALCIAMQEHEAKDGWIPRDLRTELGKTDEAIAQLEKGPLRAARLAVEKAQKAFEPEVRKYVDGESEKLTAECRALADRAEELALYGARIDEFAGQVERGLPYYLKRIMPLLTTLPRDLRIASRSVLK